MELSIIIPVYNRADTICRCLDGVYSQGLDENKFEVICVDDCSPTPSTVKAIEEYKYNNTSPRKLKLIKHMENKRQGGARNTGIRAAKGEWVMSVDSDDYWINNRLLQILKVVREYPDLDFVMFDLVRGTSSDIIEEGHYRKLNQSIMSGSQFIQTQEIPWYLWLFMYKRENFEKWNLWFEEHVRFEDADFILKYIAKSKKGRYVPVNLVYNVEHGNAERSSNIGNDKDKIEELLKIEWRIAVAANKERTLDYSIAQAMMIHAVVHRKAALKRYLWRLPFKDIKNFLYEYKYPFKIGNSWLDFSIQSPLLTTFALTMLKPVFYSLVFAKKHFVP